MTNIPQTKKSQNKRTPRSGRRVSLRRESPLAQASSFRLSEGLKREIMVFCALSLRRVLLAWARLCLAQNRDSSLKRQLAQKNQSDLLLVWPRRDVLAWARKPVLTIVLSCTTPRTRSKQLNNAFHKFTTTHKTYHGEITVTQAEKRNNRMNPSFPYLKIS